MRNTYQKASFSLWIQDRNVTYSSAFANFILYSLVVNGICPKEILFILLGAAAPAKERICLAY